MRCLVKPLSRSSAGARIEIGTLAGRDDENVYFVRDAGAMFRFTLPRAASGVATESAA